MKNSVPFLVQLFYLLIAFFFIFFPVVFLLTYLNYPHLISIRTTPTNFVIIFIFSLLFASYIYVVRKHISHRIQKTLLSILCICAVLYCILLVALTYYTYTHFIFESIDLSYYHLTMWQLSEFKLPYIWDMPTNPVWGDHFEPILLFLVPFYWISKNAGILIVAQVCMFVSGTIPLYLAIRKRFSSRFISLAFIFSYLFFGGFQVGFSYGFHPILFFPPLFLWTYYAYIKKNRTLYVVSILLCLFVKEEVSFIIVFWGLYILCIDRKVRYGLTTMVLGIAWYVLCFHIIFPHFNPEGTFTYWSRYNTTGGSGVLGVITNTLYHPLQFIHTLITPEYKVNTLFTLFGAFSFLPFFFPPSFLIILPSLFEKLLNSGIAANNGAHYTAAVGVVTLVASIESLAKLRTWLTPYPPSHPFFLSGVIVYGAFFSTVLYGCATFSPVTLPMNRAKFTSGIPIGNIIPPSREHLSVLNNILASIPDEKSVGAQYILAPHITKPFGKISPWPNVFTGPDIIIYDTQMPPVLTNWETVKGKLEELHAAGTYELIHTDQGIIVFRKN